MIAEVQNRWTRTPGAVAIAVTGNLGSYEDDIQWSNEWATSFPYSARLLELAEDWLMEEFPATSLTKLREIFPDDMEVIRSYLLS